MDAQLPARPLPAPPIPLRVPPPPDRGRRPLLVSGTNLPLIRRGEGAGEGPRSFACGNCGAVLLERVRGDEFPNTLLACAACGARNEGPA